MPERRGVKFEPRVKIHEFEKYLDQMSDFEDGQDDQSSDGDLDHQASINPADDNLQRMNSKGQPKPKPIDLLSSASIIKLALA